MQTGHIQSTDKAPGRVGEIGGTAVFHRNNAAADKVHDMFPGVGIGVGKGDTVNDDVGFPVCRNEGRVKSHAVNDSFGIFKHQTNVQGLPIFRGFDDEFFVPHSRHTEIRREDILKVKDLTLLAESEDAGVYMVMARNGREFFITGHSEYAPNTLDGEYKRDLGKGLPIEVPKNYYRNDNPDEGVLVRWRGHANLMFSNWLNYYVYQETPYDINQIK